MLTNRVNQPRPRHLTAAAAGMPGSPGSTSARGDLVERDDTRIVAPTIRRLEIDEETAFGDWAKALIGAVMAGVAIALVYVKIAHLMR